MLDSSRTLPEQLFYVKGIFSVWEPINCNIVRKFFDVWEPFSEILSHQISLKTNFFKKNNPFPGFLSFIRLESCLDQPTDSVICEVVTYTASPLPSKVTSLKRSELKLVSCTFLYMMFLVVFKRNIMMLTPLNQSPAVLNQWRICCRGQEVRQTPSVWQLSPWHLESLLWTVVCDGPWCLMT